MRTRTQVHLVMLAVGLVALAAGTSEREGLGWTCARCGATRDEERVSLAGVTLRDTFSAPREEAERAAFEAITGEPHPEHEWTACGGYSVSVGGGFGGRGCGFHGDPRVDERVGLARQAAAASDPEARRRRFLTALACPLDEGPAWDQLVDLAMREAWAELDRASWIAAVESTTASGS